MLNCLFVALGGAVGSVLRYLAGLIPVSEKCLFPVKTFSINVAGCLLIGFIVALAAKSPSLNPRFVLFLKVGLCGGFTTYSTFALESSDLLKRSLGNRGGIYGGKHCDGSRRGVPRGMDR